MASCKKAFERKQPNQQINLTGNSRVLKRWPVHWPAGYFTVGFSCVSGMLGARFVAFGGFRFAIWFYRRIVDR